MSAQRGQLGATQLLAQMLATVADPAGVGVGAEIMEVENGVEALVHMPSGDRYRVVVQWAGDREEQEEV